MAKDIVPELLEKTEKEFKNKTKKSEIVKKKILALKDGKVTHLDSNEFAIEVGKILSEAFTSEIRGDVLPDNKMYYNIAKRLIEPNMKNSFDIVSDYSRDVQEVLNKKSNISINAIKADLNQNRIDGIVNKISGYNTFEEGKWLLEEPIINFTQAIVDDIIKTNAEFQYKAGLSPKIVRKEAGGCCDWCKELAGVYEYPDVPEDVYRRHQRCRCTLDHLPGAGKKHDLWHNKWTDLDKDDKIRERIEISKKVDYKSLNDGLIEKYQSKSDEVYANLSKSEREALSEYTQGGYLGINSDLGSGIESYYTKNLNSSIDKFTVDSNIITYRGTSEKYYEGCKVGDTFEGKVFYSTSVNKDVAKAFADDATEYSDHESKGVLLEIKVPKGSKALYIGKNTDYKPDGYTVNEYELLLSNKTKYKIEKIENGKIILEMIL